MNKYEYRIIMPHMWRKIKEANGEVAYQAIQDNELLKKVGQLKKAMQTFKEKVEALEKKLTEFKINRCHF